MRAGITSTTLLLNLTRDIILEVDQGVVNVADKKKLDNIDIQKIKSGKGRLTHNNIVTIAPRARHAMYKTCEGKKLTTL